MPKTTSPPLSDELRQQIEQIAREQHREPAEVLEEACAGMSASRHMSGWRKKRKGAHASAA